MRKIIKLSDIDISESPKVRSKLREDIAEEYSQRYLLKKHGMPEPTLFRVGKKLLIGDGLHRITAMKIAGLKAQVFDVIEGTRGDCLKFALKANLVHGIRRSNEDKAVATREALGEFTELSNIQIAEIAAVDDKYVGTIRKSMEAACVIPPTEKRIGKDGRVTAAKAKAPAVVDAEIVESKYQDDTKAKTEIPDKALPYWKRKQEAIEFVSAISKLKHRLSEAQNNKDLMFTEVNFNALQADLSNAENSLSVIVPYAVCWGCQGKLVESCRVCRGRGVTSKFMYQSASKKYRDMIEGSK